MTLLPNGKVLLLAPGDAKLYDALTDTWSSAAPPPASFSAIQATVTLLDTGLVLATGGRAIKGAYLEPVADAYLYDPQADVWTTVQPMVVPRDQFGLASLPNGGALAAGGNSTKNYVIASVTAEVYPPASSGSSSAASSSAGAGGAGSSTSAASSSSSAGAGGAGSSTSAASSSASAGGAAIGSDPGPDTSAGSGCCASPGRAASSPWLGLVLLALLRRRRLACQ